MIIIVRKNEGTRRKEIIYTLKEWNKIEKEADRCGLKTSQYIMYKSLNGDIYRLNMKELAPLLNGMRIISRNINQIAHKANETNNIYVEDIEKVKEAQDELCRTLNQFLSTLVWKKV